MQKALQGKRKVEEKTSGQNQFMHELQKKTIDLLKKQGATVLEIDYLDKINELGAAEFEVMQYEFKAESISIGYCKCESKTLKEVIDFSQ
jgi:amidase